MLKTSLPHDAEQQLMKVLHGDDPSAPTWQQPASAGAASARLARRLAADLPEATIIEAGAGQDLITQLRDAAVSAQILGVAGGDGTVSAAAAVALETGLPLLVIPAGTFNHFAADLGVESARDALAALRDGEAVQVDLGLVGDRPFVNTSSTCMRWWSTARPTASQTGDVAPRRAAQSGERSEGG